MSMQDAFKQINPEPTWDLAKISFQIPNTQPQLHISISNTDGSAKIVDLFS